MITLERIVIATDLTEASAAAIELGRLFAAAFEAELHLLHIVTEPLEHPWTGYTPGDALMTAIDDRRADARRQLERFVGHADLACCRVIVATGWGDPAEEILKYAQDRQIDLIVCGTHGRCGWDRVVVGSVADRILRLARCPVLTARAPADQGAIASRSSSARS